MKLQDAYASESNAVGTWDLIGYKAPSNNEKETSKEASSTTNFSYSNTGISTQTELKGLTNKSGWKAVNNVTLNDCEATKCTWEITLSEGDNGNGVSYTATNGAADLTPSFDKIGTVTKSGT